ncbi:sensor histidine kinase [Agrococcus jejuensis]|uniref:histidine kinase n=1 Tax=Agrococcus jejuensis TaxID=399736 RepID=A0A1G8F1R5_9MICO|nr:histidine kinase [Agrococcus jejuensis]SDH76068.1 Signal transduction histidine kinase [Agrococcus jejuensis]
MKLTRYLAIAARWWPAAIAAVAFLSTVLTWYNQFFAMLLACGALAVSRRWPRWALVAAAVAMPIAVITDQPWGGSFTMPALVAGLTAAIAVFDLEPMRWRLYIGAVIVGVATLSGLVRAAIAGAWMNASYGYVSLDGGMVVGFFIMGVIAWAVPFGLRAFRDAVRAERDKTTVQARTVVVESELRDERLRADLTHDFHDVMAHSLAVLAAQAEGLRLTHAEHPERIDPVLTTISDTARLALVEVRQLLERVDDDARRPQPTIEDIPALIDQTRSAGPTVTFHDAGRHGHLPRIGGIAAYRIVQEALTNALRHGGPDVDAIVTLSWTGPGLSLAVSSPIRERDALGPIGRGITGMHERAKQAGGWVDVDADGERFVVTAYLPYEPEALGSTILGEDQLPTVPVSIVPSPLVPNPMAPAAADVATGPMPAPPTMPTPAATWGEANARQVQLGEPGGLSSPGSAPAPPPADGRA